MSADISRRQLLKASLIGVGGLAVTATRLIWLETLIAAPLALGRWRQLTPKTAPSPRTGGVVAYDAARGLPVLFGGNSGPGVRLNADTWIWDGRTWILQKPSLSPPARVGGSLAYYPPTKTVVLFGGSGNQGSLDDTWLWNGKTWSPILGMGPRARIQASMAFDPITNSLILFGGYSDTLLNDTWKWDGTSWRALTPGSSPPPLAAAGIAYSASAGKLILFGGSPLSTAGSQESWAWDGMNWSRISFGPSPPARYGAAMAANPEGRLILLFGGVGNGTYLGDTWTLTGTWSKNTDVPAPAPRSYAALVPDPSGSSLLLFGGESASGRLGDSWAWGPF